MSSQQNANVKSLLKEKIVMKKMKKLIWIRKKINLLQKENKLKNPQEFHFFKEV